MYTSCLILLKRRRAAIDHSWPLLLQPRLLLRNDSDLGAKGAAGVEEQCEQVLIAILWNLFSVVLALIHPFRSGSTSGFICAR